MIFKAIYELFFGKRFEFYTAYSVQEASSRMRALNHEGYRALTGKRVNSRSATITPDHYFQCQQNFGENMDVFCKGYVREHGDGMYVAGRTYLGIGSRIALGFAIIWLTIWTIVTLTNQIPIMFLLGLTVVIFMFASMTKVQNELHDSIHHVFGKSKKKNIESKS